MRIGIDAKWYFTGPVSTRTMLQNLLPILFEIYSTHQWFVFLDRKDRGKDFPIKHSHIEIIYVWTPNNMLSNLFILPRYARRLSLDVVLFQTFPGSRKEFKSIAFIHDVLFKSFPQYFTWKERLYFFPLAYFTKKADRLIATTNFVKNELIKYGYAESVARIDLVPLGVSSNFKPLALHDTALAHKLRKKYNLPDDFILFVGRLNARKNIESLLRAFPMLKNKSVSLIIAGKEDWKKPNLEKLMTNTAIGSRVLFTGPIHDNELPALYAMSKIFCFPSFAEGFGLPPLEAMASAVPVVVSDSTALPEICGSAALYIDANDPATIAHSIDELLENQKLYEKMKTEGINRASSFTWTITSNKLMESIASSLKKDH